MSELRIIGVGSASGDDQAGWLVVQALRRGALAQRYPGNTRIFALDRPGVQLMRHLEGADVVVLIDAVRSGAAPGTIHRVDDAAQIEADWRVSCHGLGLASTLELARALDALPATVLLYGIEMDSASAGPAPSKSLADAVDRLAARIADDLALPLGGASAAGSAR